MIRVVRIGYFEHSILAQKVAQTFFPPNDAKNIKTVRFYLFTSPFSDQKLKLMSQKRILSNQTN
jgi:hypothetical protein